MRRVIMTVALLAVTIAFLPVTNASAHAPYCQFNWNTTTGVKRTIRCAVSHYSVPGGVSKALRIAWRESRDHAGAKNDQTGACGVYQHMPKLWPPRVHRYYWGKDRSRYNGRTNTLVSIRMVHRHGWGPWGG